MSDARGLLDTVGAMGARLEAWRRAIDIERSAGRTEAIELEQAALRLDKRVAALGARAQLLDARAAELESVARRELRAEVFGALQVDRVALERAGGRRRTPVALMVSMRSDDGSQWRSEVWVPASPLAPVGSPAHHLLVMVRRAVQDALAELGADAAVVTHTRADVAVISGTAPVGCGREQLQSALVRSMDRGRVVTAALHDAHVEVSVVWLDLPTSPSTPAEEA